MSLSDQIASLYDNPQQQAYEYSLRHPGRVWFPWNPLSNVFAERRLDHFDRAVRDWDKAGETVTQSRLLDSIPASVTLIAYPPDILDRNRHVAKILVGDQEPIQIDGLPGWNAYELGREGRESSVEMRLPPTSTKRPGAS